MFEFKKKNKCGECAEINYLEKLRELKVAKEELKSQKLLYSDSEYINSVFVYGWEKRHYLTDKFSKIARELVLNGVVHFDDFDKMIGSGEYSLYPMIIDLRNYLNGYVEYKQHEENIDAKIIEIEEEIYKIKERLGI